MFRSLQQNGYRICRDKVGIVLTHQTEAVTIGFLYYYYFYFYFYGNIYTH